MDNFKQFLEITESDIGFAELSERHLIDMLPELGLPTVTKTSKIRDLYDKKNPIAIVLWDGTKLFFTYDQYRKIEGKPEKGKTLTVTLYRLSGDKSVNPSKIAKCVVS